MPSSLTTQTFIERAKLKHGASYDYAQAEYVKNRIPVTIRCLEHGIFQQTPEKHLAGKGCKFCAEGKNADVKRLPKAELLDRLRQKHKGKYAYPDFEYRNNKQKIKIICPDHGEFEQQINSHLRGRGCVECHKRQLAKSLQLDTPSYIMRAKAEHGDKYDYSKVDYTDSTAKIEIICPQHGAFEQIARNHLQGNGCPQCANVGPSNEEAELWQYIKAIAPDAEQSNRTLIAPLELDIYSPSKRIAVEYNGLYWHSEKYREKKYHLNKLKACEKAGIRLLQIHSDEWLNQKTLVQSYLAALFGIWIGKIAARKTELQLIEATVAREFYRQNHIQGFVGAERHYGLIYEDEIVAMASYAKIRPMLGGNSEAEYELSRFCNARNKAVIGGLGKLLAPMSGHNVLSYCDRRLFDGKAYYATGFQLLRESPPSYCYVNGRKKLSRYQCQKHKLEKWLENYDEKLTEVENMCNAGFYRVFDCGNLVFLKPKNC